MIEYLCSLRASTKYQSVALCGLVPHWPEITIHYVDPVTSVICWSNARSWLICRLRTAVYLLRWLILSMTFWWNSFVCNRSLLTISFPMPRCSISCDMPNIGELLKWFMVSELEFTALSGETIPSHAMHWFLIRSDTSSINKFLKRYMVFEGIFTALSGAISHPLVWVQLCMRWRCITNNLPSNAPTLDQFR